MKKLLRSRVLIIGLILFFGIGSVLLSGDNLKAKEVRIPIKTYGVTINGMQNINPNATGVVKLTFSDGTILQKAFTYGVSTYYNFDYVPDELHSVCASLELSIIPECPVLGACLENRSFLTNPVGTSFLDVSVLCPGH